MKAFEFLEFSFVDVIDILLVAVLLFYVYKLVKGTVAINIFIGIVIIYIIWKITDVMNMDVLSNILGNFISVGFFALIVVFQQEIRKFLLLIGSTNLASSKNIIRYSKFLSQNKLPYNLSVDVLIASCESMSKTKTGAIIILERNNRLEFVKKTGHSVAIELTDQILETLFYKNSPMHDGAIVIKNNTITATRVILPVSESGSIPSRFGLRHRAAIGITEKTDALALVISEQTGGISYIKNGSFSSFKDLTGLKRLLSKDISI